MTCWPKQQITIFDNPDRWGYWYDEWNTLGTWHHNAKIIEVTECEKRAFEWIHSPSKYVRNDTAKLISKILNTD